MEKEVKKENGVFKFAVPTGTALSVAHSLAVVNNWYRSIPWIDILIHFGWAVTLGLVGYWIIKKFPQYIDLGKNLFFTILVGLALSALFGILWEFGEFIFDSTAHLFAEDPQRVQLGIGDTLKDLAFDMLGGASVAIFAWLRYHRGRKSL